MKQAAFSSKLFIYAPMALSLGILAWLIAPNAHSLLATLKESNPWWLVFSLFFSFGSYALMGLSLWEVLRILGWPLPFLEAAGISFVSTTVNYFFSSGGISGFATRAHLLSKRNVPYGASVTSSVVLTVFIYLILAVIIVEGVFLQILKTNDFGRSFLEGVVGVGFVAGIALALILLFFHEELRHSWSRKIFKIVNHIIYFFSRREIPHENFIEFERQLNSGINTIHSRKYELPKVVGYVAADWVCNILILFFAFKALGVTMGASKLVIGFAFGMIMTVIPILPGGLGAMEAAMTAAYSQMGIEVGHALTASLLFRLFYYIVPSLTSIPIYWGLKISERRCYQSHNPDKESENDGEFPYNGT
ncbi:MAG: lysylphosphatidylglycerol synthase transmembrane domain-containing protein [Elusimicrobia bacterium]|nr:lysylphosphatidylglycerol synthase transmembrane domain-containing protein [Elusimicrobiota bacterium]